MKKDALLFIEDCVRNLQLEKEIAKNSKLIENTIKREFGIPVKVIITDNTKNMFFGMCVYPEQKEIMEMTRLIVLGYDSKHIEKVYVDNMKKTTKVIEIDSILLYDQNLNMNPSEITAIMLHEIGHIVASEVTVGKLKRFKELLLKKLSHSGTRQIFNDLKQMWFFTPVFSLPVAQIFADQFNSDLINEKKADDFAVKNGYKEELISALNKMIINGKGETVQKTSAECDKDIEITVDWTIENITSLRHRKDTLRRSLKVIELTTPSKHIAKVIKSIKDEIFHNTTYAGARREIVQEAFILSNKKKHKAPSGAIDSSGRVRKLVIRDLDIYRAELERVHTVDDKIFLLERLYDLMDVAEYAKYMLKENPRKVMQSEQTINLYIDSLNEIIKLTNAKRISQTKFGLYIKYPSDYEG